MNVLKWKQSLSCRARFSSVNFGQRGVYLRIRIKTRDSITCVMWKRIFSISFVLFSCPLKIPRTQKNFTGMGDCAGNNIWKYLIQECTFFCFFNSCFVFIRIHLFFFFFYSRLSISLPQVKKTFIWTRSVSCYIIFSHISQIKIKTYIFFERKNSFYIFFFIFIFT